jgi:hypothetical protein
MKSRKQGWLRNEPNKEWLRKMFAPSLEVRRNEVRNKQRYLEDGVNDFRELKMKI